MLEVSGNTYKQKLSNFSICLKKKLEFKCAVKSRLFSIRNENFVGINENVLKSTIFKLNDNFFERGNSSSVQQSKISCQAKVNNCCDNTFSQKLVV